MDNNVRSTIPGNDEVIDLKELMLYILRKWRVLIALGLIGALLGGCYGFLKPEKEQTPLNMDKIQIKEVDQYARYEQMYADQLAWEEESVFLNLDPTDACYASRIYLLRAPETDLTVIGEMYRVILQSGGTIDALIEASGLECSQRAIRQMVSVDFRRLQEERAERQDLSDMQNSDTELSTSVIAPDELFVISGSQERGAEVSVSVVGPDEETCQAMLAFLDGQIDAINKRISAEFGNASCEMLAENSGRGYVAEIEAAQLESTEKLAEYAAKLTTLKKTLTSDDLTYYGIAYQGKTMNEEASGSSRAWLKWAIVIGVVFGFLGVCVYGVMFLVDGHIKTADELLAYGLHPFAVMADEQARRKKNPIDRLLAPKSRVNDTAYLTRALKGLKLEHVMLSGSTEDEMVAALLSEMKAEDGSLLTGAMLSMDAAAQETAAQADGVVLLVHLWKTRRDDLEQEIRICQKLGYPVLGTVVIG